MYFSLKPSITLEQTRQYTSVTQDLFQPQSNYPQFFLTNLLDPHRIIFKFKDTSTNNAIRVFYFQFLRLCFNIQMNDLMIPRNYYIEIKNIILDDRFRIKCQVHQQLYKIRENNILFKSLLKQFFSFFEMEHHNRFQKIILQYPILDSIFLNIFKTFLSDYGILDDYDTQLQVSTVIYQLSRIFEIRITKINECYRFDEADVFCYIQNQQQLFLAFKEKTNKTIIQSKSLQYSQNQNKQNQLNNLLNLISSKVQPKKFQISTVAIIQQQSSFISQSKQNSSIFSTSSIPDINLSLPSQQPQSFIKQCQLFSCSSSNKSAQNSLNNILLETSAYKPITNYQDYTSTLVLQIISQPYKQNIRILKDKAKQRKRLNNINI